MKKWSLFILSIVFSSVYAQELKYEIAVIGFYNLENLFDTDSSMQSVNVDNYLTGDPEYVQSETYSDEKYYGAAWNKEFENISISKSKIDISKLPVIPMSALSFEKPDRKEFNEIYKKNLSKSEFKEEINKNPKLFSKKEFVELINSGDTYILQTKEIVSKVNDTDNTPKGSRQYTGVVYEDKLNKLASVISELGKNYSKDGVVLLGLSEIENKQVVEDLIKTSALKKSGFSVEEYDCMYSRGVDVGLMYQTKYFKVLESHTIQVPLYNDKKETERYYSRDVLWVEGELLGEKVHVFVNHWPSRYGGEMKSSPGREKAAQVCKEIIDSLMKIDPNTQVILMGDLNDDPHNKSIAEVLSAKKDVSDVNAGDLYNPLFKDNKKGYSSLAYRGSWNLFDQVIVSSSFVDEKVSSWKLHDAEIVYNPDWVNRFGGYEGGPNRSYGGNNYQGGFSDHLPSVVYLKRVAQEDKDKDGIVDKEDACPEEAGLKAFNGCPDSDEDGIMDKEDLCPNVAGLASFKGCPDTDNDGVKDSEDACVKEAGPKENRGCPYTDKDGDGVLDKDDACPETKGVKENKGCPELKEEVKKAVKAVFENLVFDTGKSTIKKSSDDELEALAKIMKENPELLLTISGHTDNVGDDAANMELSKNRANAVKERLVSLGVEGSRMTALFFGETQPVATNDTAEGRQANRRVVFDIKSK